MLFIDNVPIYAKNFHLLILRHEESLQIQLKTARTKMLCASAPQSKQSIMLYDFLKGLNHKNYEPIRLKEKEGAQRFTISKINYF